MTEFQWKNNFIDQDKKHEHINKFVLLLLMLKVKRSNTKFLEKSIAALNVLDFYYYEKFYLDNIKAVELSKPNRFLHNQEEFKKILDKFVPGEKLRISLPQQKYLFEKFSRYVNLKDVKTVDKAYRFFAYGIILFVFLLKSFFSNHDIEILLFVNFVEIIASLTISLIFNGKFKSIKLNYWRINEELCLCELQKELEMLEKLLEVKHDPYENETYDELWNRFKSRFDVPDNFIERCRENKIIDENNIVMPKYNHCFIQYLKQNQHKPLDCENFDWQLINHIVILDIERNRKSEFVDKEFKIDQTTGEYISKEGKAFSDFCNIFR